MFGIDARQLVCRLSALGVLLGWGGSFLLGLTLGEAAGVDTWFITALSVGITATIALAVAVVMPDQARIFALGYSAGLEAGRAAGEPPREVRRPTLVR